MPLAHSANDNQRAPASPAIFDYSAPAEIFMVNGRQSRGRARYRRFATAAEAIHFVVEEVPEPLQVGVVMEVREERFDHRAIHALYAGEDYPLARG
jgi:hypothetical protein